MYNVTMTTGRMKATRKIRSVKQTRKLSVSNLSWVLVTVSWVFLHFLRFSSLYGNKHSNFHFEGDKSE